jgi:hypothetical protein
MFAVAITAADMFIANSKLTGLKFTYDGNPHSFGSRHPSYVNYRDEQDTTSSTSQVQVQVQQQQLQVGIVV